MKAFSILIICSLLSLHCSLLSQQGYQQILGDGDTKWDLIGPGPGTFTDNPMDVSIGPDGTVYVNTQQAYLLALDPADGDELWYASGHFFPPSIGSDGTLYSGSNTDLVAIKPDGSIKWSIPLGEEISSSPAQGADGTIYVRAGQYLVAIDTDTPQEKWRLAVGTATIYAPTVGHDGTVYVVAGSEIIAINSVTQTEKWRFTTDDPITSSAVSGSYGIVYAGASSRLYAINPDGTQKWKYNVGAYIASAPAIGYDGTLYLPASFLGSGYSGYGKLLAIHPEGYILWGFRTDYYNRSTPAIGADGTIFLASEGYMGLLAIDPYGVEKWRYPSFGNARWSPALATDGTIYFSSSLGAFTAVESSCGGLSGSPWPMKGHDAQHTGRNDEYTPACEAPVIIEKPVNQIIDEGGTATLSVKANGKEPMSYQWYEGLCGDKSNPQGTDTIFITPVLSESRHYWVEVTNECGFTFSRAVTVATGTEGELKWFFQSDEEVLCTPAIDEDGTIYFGTENATMYAVLPDGTEKWHYQAIYEPEGSQSGSVTNFIIRSDPTIGSDGTIYFGTAGYYDSVGTQGQTNFGFLWALNPDGSMKWKHLTNETQEYWAGVNSSPALGLDGTLYVLDYAAHLYAVNPDGTRKWQFEPEKLCGSWSSPTIGHDGTIYYSLGWYDEIYFQRLYAINPDGTEKWQYTSENSNGGFATPTIGSDGTIYIPGLNEYFLAINPDGTEKWHFYTGDLCSQASLGTDGTVYFSSGQGLGHAYAVDPDNADLIWKSEALLGETIINNFPAIGADGIIYLIMGTRIYALNPADGSELWNESRGDAQFSSPVIAPDGTLYFGMGKGSISLSWGYLWAITTSSLGLADSYWPVAGQNLSHWQRDPEATIQCEEPVIIIQPQDQTIASGQQATLSVSATGTALNYEWFEGSSGDQSTAVDTGAVMITKALDQDTDYWVMVSNACGEEYSQTATVNVYAGIGEATQLLEFEIYPNPCSDKIQITNSKIQNNSTPNTQPSTLEIIDLHGRVVYEKESSGIREYEIVVDVSHLPAGLYLLKMQTEDAVGVRKIIKR